MRLMGSTRKFNLATVQQILALKRMCFFTFGEELDLANGITQGDVREFYLKMYSHVGL